MHMYYYPCLYNLYIFPEPIAAGDSQFDLPTDPEVLTGSGNDTTPTLQSMVS